VVIVALLLVVAVAFAIPATRKTYLGRFIRGEWPYLSWRDVKCRIPVAFVVDPC
jgi:hypothetical protein